MSYHATAAASYREREVLSATPEQLVVIVYDHLLAQLARARVATDVRNVEARMETLGRARDAIAELLATLDVERGGEIAMRLGGIYAFLMSELVDESRRPSSHRLERIATMVRELRDAFAQAAGAAPHVTAA